MLNDLQETMFQMMLAERNKTIEIPKEKVISRRKEIINEVRFNINKARAKSWIKKNLQK
jgi:hypothetical protein